MIKQIIKLYLKLKQTVEDGNKKIMYRICIFGFLSIIPCVIYSCYNWISVLGLVYATVSVILLFICFNFSLDIDDYYYYINIKSMTHQLLFIIIMLIIATYPTWLCIKWLFVNVPHFGFWFTVVTFCTVIFLSNIKKIKESIKKDYEEVVKRNENIK